MKVSVGIITRRRKECLRDCLESLKNQEVKPFEIVVVENGEGSDSEKLVEEFKNRLVVRWCREKKRGTAAARNRVLEEVKGEVVAFIDDDCVAHGKWIKEIEKGFEEYPEASVLAGGVRNYYPENPSASVVSLYYKVWRRNRIDLKSRRVLNYAVLDTKNIAYKVDSLREKELLFDEDLFDPITLGKWEDCELGLRIQVRGMQARYWPGMVVWHKEGRGVLGVLERAFSSGAVKARYEVRKKSLLEEVEFGGERKKRGVEGKMRLIKESGSDLVWWKWFVYLFLIFGYRIAYFGGYWLARLKEL